MLFTSIDDTKITQDQSLALKSKIIDYVRNALIYNRGYLVFEVKDLSSFEFDFYYSSGVEIEARYEETREETINRIIYTLECKQLREANVSADYLDKIMLYLYNYIVGFISSNVLYEKYNVEDKSWIFRDKVSPILE